MPKVSALFALLITFAFSNANAPTFQLWRHLPAAEAATNEPDGPGSFADYSNATLAFSQYDQEFSEEGALERFEIDELFLPRLNVELPELFDWNEVDSSYYADLAQPTLSMSYELSTLPATPIRLTSIGHNLAGRPHAVGGGARVAGTTGSESSSTQSAGKGASVTTSVTEPTTANDTSGFVEQSAENDEPLPDEESENIAAETVPPLPQGPIFLDLPLDSKEPVQVPAPGALGLFALGLAGMRLAGRKKNRSG
jgi:PEP-CTERM motif